MLESSLHLGTWLRLFRPGSPWVAPFVPTPVEVARRMLSLARLQEGETVLDLGCGDGRLLKVGLEEFGAAHAIGFEMDSSLATVARTATSQHAARVDIRTDDIFSAEPTIAKADVVVLYLSNTGNARLLPLLRRSLQPTARVVSYVWEMPVGATRTVLMPGSGAPIHLFEHSDFL